MGIATIRLGDLQIRRLVVGSNAISGFSHASRARTERMLDYFTVEATKRFLGDCEAAGLNAVVARVDNFIMRTLREYWREGGKIRWIAQTAPEHRDPRRNIKLAAASGASAIYVHGGIVDRHFAEGTMDEVAGMLDLVRSLGLPAGVAAHEPAALLHAQRHGYRADFFMVCMYQISGYRGRQGEELEEHFDDADRRVALAALSELEKPCLAYKVMAAGRKKTLEEGLADVAPALRASDGVVLGMFPPDGEDLIRRNVLTFERLVSR